MFVDNAKISIKAGNGGNGAVSFHREKFVNAGGPDGGDGGQGGNVVFLADTNLSTLVDFKYKKKFEAENGEPGRSNKCFGKNGKDLVIKVPKGTLVKEANTGRILADMSGDEPIVVAKGGRGGWGNTHFATPTRQIPRFAKPGLQGESYDVILELKLLADVGLVGFPNVGKSSLITCVSGARPVIANYHFTTLTPVLGVVRVDENKSFVMADIPGLIEGASEGVGLGHEFLRHVDRCRLILHVVDVSGCEGRDPIEDFKAINRELLNFNEELALRPQIVIMNKCDIADEESILRFEEFIKGEGLEAYRVSAAAHIGTRELIGVISKELDKLPPIKYYEREEISEVEVENKLSKFEIKYEDGIYFVEADWLMNVLGNVNPDDYESLQYFQRILRTSGIIDRLEEMGVQEGDTVSILDFEFDYIK